MRKTKIDITNWLLSGTSFCGHSLKEVFINNKAFKFAGREPDYGYFYSPQGWRVGVSGKCIDEISIPFLALPEKSEIVILYKGKEQKLKKLKIHEVLELLNQLELLWEPVKNHDTSRLLIILPDTQIYFTFDVFDGTLELISQVTWEKG